MSSPAVSALLGGASTRSHAARTTSWSLIAITGTLQSGPSQYTTNAVCAEPSEIFSLRGNKLRTLCEKDPYMGFLLSKRLLVILKKRYDHRTEQFLKVIKHHPDMKDLF